MDAEVTPDVMIRARLARRMLTLGFGIALAFVALAPFGLVPTASEATLGWLVVATAAAACARFIPHPLAMSVGTVVCAAAAVNSAMVAQERVGAQGVLSTVSIALLWTGAVLAPRYAVIVAVYVMAALIGTGGTLSVELRGNLEPTTYSLALLAAHIGVPVGLSAALDASFRAVQRTTGTRLVALAERERELESRLASKARELEASRSQLLHVQKLKTVGTMASGLAHELNNILTPIRGLAELLLEGPPPEQSQRYGQRILDSAMAAAQITGALLTYTRQGTFQPVRTNARLLLQSHLLPVLGRSLPNGIRLEIHLETDASIDVDRLLFQQAITNLAFNAIDAMPMGGSVTIGLEVRPADGSAHEPRTARIWVRDEGIGIPPEDMERIFDPFYTTKAVGAGTGLGLAMVLGTVERHGGTIEVESEVGRGTTFTLVFPLPEDEPTPPEAWPALSAQERGPIIALVADDDDLADEAEELLGSTQCATLVVPDARAARTLIAEMGDRLALCVLDLDIGGGEGRGLLARIRELFPELPIVVLSSTALDPSLQKVLGAGPGRALRKPFDPGLFSTFVTDLLHPEQVHHRSLTPLPIHIGDSGPSPRGR